MTMLRPLELDEDQVAADKWNVLVNPLHPQFSLKWVVADPDAYTLDARLLPVKRGIRSRRTPRN